MANRASPTPPMIGASKYNLNGEVAFTARIEAADVPLAAEDAVIADPRIGDAVLGFSPNIEPEVMTGDAVVEVVTGSCSWAGVGAGSTVVGVAKP